MKGCQTDPSVAIKKRKLAKVVCDRLIVRDRMPRLENVEELDYKVFTKQTFNLVKKYQLFLLIFFI